MNKTEGFLRLILPETGYYCIAIFNNEGRKPRHIWFKELDKMAEAILAADALGQTVYHACASYVQPTRRTRENVQAVRCLWADFDGEQQSTIQSITRFTRELGHPLPTLVNSGRGIHAYWRLERDITGPEWLGYARGFRQVCRTEGLGIDPSRACDAASILRPPGSHNRKDGERLVELILPGPSDIRLSDIPVEAGIPTPDAHGGAAPGAGQLNNLSAVSLPPHIAGLTPLEIGLLDEPADADAIADRCAQVGNMRATRGLLSNPLWFSALGVLAFCGDGDRIGHEWSQGHPSYEYDETQSNLDRKRANTGPTTCRQFQADNLGGCSGCPFRGKITTPLELGRGRWSVISNEPRPATAETVLSELRLSGANVDLALPELPHPFFWKGVQLWKRGWDVPKGGGGSGEEKQVLDWPFYPVEVRLVPGGDESIVFRVCPPRTAPFNLAMRTADLTGAGANKAYAGPGLHLKDLTALMEFVELMKVDLTAKGRISEYDHMGWTETGFIVGDRVYAKDAKPDLASINAETLKSANKLFPLKGDYQTWRYAAKKMLEGNLWTQALSLLAGFAAPLMKFSTDLGGAVFCFQSQRTTTGKSLGIEAAASIWGDFKTCNITISDTLISRGVKLGVAHSLPVFYDDMMIGSRESNRQDEMKKFIHEFQQGRDRARADVKAELRTSREWCTLLLCTSNQSMWQELRGDAMGQRILEFSCADNRVVAVSDKSVNFIRNKLHENCGQAGRLFAQALVAVEDKLPAMILDAEMRLRRAHKFEGGPHRFWLAAMSACETAARILKATNILDYDFDPAIYNACEELLTGEQSTLTQEQQRQTLVDFITLQQPHCVNVTREGFVQAPPLIVTARYEDKTERYYAEMKQMRAWASQVNLNLSDFRKSLPKGAFVTTGDFNLQEGLPGPQLKSRCHVFDLRVLREHGVDIHPGSAARTPLSPRIDAAP